MKVLDGKAVAAARYEKLRQSLAQLKVPPKILFVRVGEDPASRTYVNAKAKKCAELGLQSETRVLDEKVSEAELLKVIAAANGDSGIHGILVQLPLPKHLNKERVLLSIDPAKDVDGLHPMNLGRLLQGAKGFVPCTPAGIVAILDHYGIELEGKHAVVVGRSEIVGKPVALLLLQRNATVTIAHSRTPDLASITRQADVLVVAVGKAGVVGAVHVKPGAVVIDVGINRTEKGLVGDVDFGSLQGVAGAATPVPGGVGPMTICLLMENLAAAAGIRSN